MILHRSFVKEVLTTCAAVISVLISIVFVVRLVGFLRAAAEGDIPVNSVLVLLLLKLVTYLDVLLPLVVYLSMIMVMGRWIRDNELTVINACGIGLNTFLKPLLILALIIGGLVAAFSLYLSPLSARAGSNIENDFKNRTDITGIIPGVFTETQNGSGVYFVEHFDEDADVLYNVFVYNRLDEDDSVIYSDTGIKIVDPKTNDDFLRLFEGTQYRGQPGETKYGVMEFEQYDIRIKQNSKQAGVALKAKTMVELLAKSNAAHISEFHRRISQVFWLLPLMLFALSFSSISNRKNRFPGFGWALIIYFAYLNFMSFTTEQIKKDVFNPYLSLWLLHATFLALAIYMFYRRCKNKPFIPFQRS